MEQTLLPPLAPQAGAGSLNSPRLCKANTLSMFFLLLWRASFELIRDAGGSEERTNPRFPRSFEDRGWVGAQLGTVDLTAGTG